MNIEMDSDRDYNSNIIDIEALDQLILEDSMKISRKRKASLEPEGQENKNKRPDGEQHTFDSIVTGKSRLARSD